MAKHKNQEKKIGGPYLAAALFCEKTLEDKEDGSVSVIRIVDQVTIQIPPIAPADFPSETNPVVVQANGLLSFKTGGSPGEHKLRLVMESPSGKRKTVLEQVIPLTPLSHGGINLRLKNILLVHVEGLYWLHVVLDGRRLTRIPLNVIFQRSELPPLTTAPPTNGPDKKPKPKPNTNKG